jgi:hypothetical protein
VLTVFISNPFPEHLEPMGDNWVIREYGPDDVLVRKSLPVAGTFLKPFPLTAQAVPEDFPLWDGGGVPEDLEQAILTLERAGKIQSYYDLVTHTYEHKIGGYPSFCQSGVDPGEGFEFVFQISSDSKINLNVVDSGSLMFWKHNETGEWALYYDLLGVWGQIHFQVQSAPFFPTPTSSNRRRFMNNPIPIGTVKTDNNPRSNPNKWF